MEKIKNAIFGYNREQVDNMISEKDNLIKSQQKDINYLRNQNQQLKKAEQPKKRLKFYKSKSNLKNIKK